MTNVCVLAAGAVSALGIGRDAYRAAFAGEPARCVLNTDPALSAAGLTKPYAGRAPADLGVPPSSDRAEDLLACALAQALRALDEARPGWRAERIGVALGSSSGGMLTAERFFAARAEGRSPDELAALARRATYFAPFERALAEHGLSSSIKQTQILAACAASTIAIGIAARWLERGACDLVLTGGYDGLSVFVASGFEALRATTASRPRPFRAGRDGMSLGEGAGVLALVRSNDTRGADPLFQIAGFGASTDAVHITAPDRTGAGLRRAGAAALTDAGFPASQIHLVSAHATATPYNDAMESRAITALFEDADQPIVHPFKAQIGHTLGAAGVLESLAAADALRESIAPGAAGDGDLDPDAPALLLPRGERRPLSSALKLSAAFGGANAALVLSTSQIGRPRGTPRPVYVRAFAHATSANLDTLSRATGAAKDRLARLDTLCRLGLSAVAALAETVGRDHLHGAGIVAGHGLATIDTNDTFDARRRARGATAVEPRLFPATSPNAVAGECAILYQLTGPGFATGAGLDGATEAMLAAAELIAASDTNRMVIVAADDAGPVARDLLHLSGLGHRPLEPGAVALLLTSDPEGALSRVDLDRPLCHSDGPIGHLALLRWLDGVASKGAAP
jgi:3-oxoacyl-[acyl-carrier-protein] synthase-1/3-oxoacyl-[acyl-carrier-protein] synthase II